MRKQSGFTILELVIAFAFSTLIIFTLMQAYYQLMRYLENGREMMIINRKVSLCFNQLERDIMCSYIPELQEEIVPVSEQKGLEYQKKKEEKEKKKPKTSEEKKKFYAEQRKEKSIFFKAASVEGESVKVGDRKFELLKYLTFITSNPFQVYGQKRVRLVRVRYELEVDKEKSKRDKPSYKLIRKESRDLKNVDLKVSEFDYDRIKANPIKAHLIADNIKGFYLAYVTHKEDKKEDKASGKQEAQVPLKEKQLWFPAWGEKEETQGVVPHRIEVRLTFWNDKKTRDYSFDALFPVLSYPTKVIEIEEEKLADTEQVGTPQAARPGQALAPGQALVSPSQPQAAPKSEQGGAA